MAAGGSSVSHENNSIPIDALLQNLVRKKARQIIGRIGCPEEDPSDIEQEFWLRFLPRLRRYDPSEGQPGAFIRVVSDRIAANLVRERYAQKRDRRGQQSLNVLVQTHDGITAELAQTISQEDRDRRLGKKSRSDEERCQLLLDLEVLLARMPSLHRELAELLKHMSLSAAARVLGRSVEKTKRSVALLLRRFEEASMHDYV
jgi:hypothetical protein